MEFLTSNKYTAYPFKENAEGIAYNSTGDYGTLVGVTLENPKLPSDALVDASIMAAERVYFHKLKKNSAGTYDVWFEWHSGGVKIFTIDPIVSAGDYTLVDLIDDSVSVNVVIRLLVTDKFIDYLAGIPYLDTLVDFGRDLEFDPSTITEWAHGLRLLGINASGTLYSNSTPDITFKNGYNTEISYLGSEDVDGINKNEIISIDVGQGIGEGLHPCIDEGKEPYAPGIIPDGYGNIHVTGDECTNIIPHAGTGIIEIQSDCLPCCDCEDYLNATKLLKGLVIKAETLKRNLTLLHTSLDEAIAHYHAALEDYEEIGVLAGGSRRDHYAVFYVAVGNRLKRESITVDGSFTVSSPWSIIETSSSFPVTLAAGFDSGCSYWWRCQAAPPPPASITFQATITYTYEGTPKTIIKSVTL